MVGGAYAYFNYKFAQYKFIDFSKINLFHQRQVFIPIKDNYIVFIYSSNANNIVSVVDKFTLKHNNDYEILTIDINQKIPKENNTTALVGSINTILHIVQRFNIYNVPSVFYIKKHKKLLYKQDSNIKILDSF